MGGLESFLEQTEFWHWLIFGGILIILEVVLPGTILLWTGISAVIVGLLQLMFPAMPWELQMVIFAVLSLVTVTGYRIWIKKRPIETLDPTLNKRGAQYIGREVTVQETQLGGRGRTMLDDSTWLIRSEDGEELNRDSIYRVTGVDGATLLISKDS